MLAISLKSAIHKSGWRMILNIAFMFSFSPPFEHSRLRSQGIPKVNNQLGTVNQCQGIEKTDNRLPKAMLR